MKRAAFVLVAALLVAGIFVAWPSESESQQRGVPNFQTTTHACQNRVGLGVSVRVVCGVHNLSFNTSAHGVLTATVTSEQTGSVYRRQERIFLRPREEMSKAFVFSEARAQDSHVCRCQSRVTATLNPVR